MGGICLPVRVMLDLIGYTLRLCRISQFSFDRGVFYCRFSVAGAAGAFAALTDAQRQETQLIRSR